MTKRSALGGGGYQLGDLRPLNAAAVPQWFTEGSQEWLMTGVLRANTGGAYSELLNKFQNGYGVHVAATADRLNTSSTLGPVCNNASSGNMLASAYFLGGGRYVFMPSCGGSSNQFAHGASLAGSFTQDSLPGCRAHCAVGGYVAIATATGSSDSVKLIHPSGTPINPASGPVMSLSIAASNGTNLAMMCGNNASNAASDICTSTNGDNWTIRTGTNNTLTAVHGAHYAPHLGLFFRWGTASGGPAILKSSDGYTESVALAPTSAYSFFNGSGGGSQAFAASSPNETLIACQRTSDNLQGYLRTTDGTNWTFVSPFLTPSRAGTSTGSSAGTQVPIQYDAARARFCAVFAPSGSVGYSDGPAYAYSTNGTAWAMSGAAWCSGYTFCGFVNPNGQDIAFLSSFGGTGMGGTMILQSASKFSGTPGHVGTVAGMGPSTAAPAYSTFLTPRYFIRIK